MFHVKELADSQVPTLCSLAPFRLPSKRRNGQLGELKTDPPPSGPTPPVGRICSFEQADCSWSHSSVTLSRLSTPSWSTRRRAENCHTCSRFVSPPGRLP